MAEPTTLTELAAGRITASPEAVALVDDSGALTFADLDRRADTVAARLMAIGVGRGAIVGVLMDRSPTMVAVWLGVLRAGAAYLPMDGSYPQARLRFMATDSGAALVVTGPETSDLAGGLGVRVLAFGRADWSRDVEVTRPARAGEVRPDDLAYIIYTSGSTGRPKGVMVEHRNIANTVVWHGNAIGVGPGDRVGQTASSGFDVASWEFWANLVAGAEVHIPPEPVRRSPSDLCDWVVGRGLTAVCLITPVADLALRHGWLAGSSLRVLMTGGEKLRSRPPADARYRFVNLYGPTETAVIASWAVVEPELEDEIPIGRPIDHATVHVLDAEGAVVPTGADGELYVGGAGVARGYLGQPELTRERFVPDPFRPGGRLYRTGDVVRRRADGQLEFRGRVDDQVKVGGFRIELGEIDEVLRAHPDVSEAATKLWSPERGHPRLIGFVTGAPGLDVGAIRAWLATRLPAHMVPVVLTPLSELPLTAHQKVDREALPDPAMPPDEAAPVFSDDPAVRELAQDWRDTCGVVAGSLDDTLVTLGAGSLDLIALRVRVCERLGRVVPAAAIGLTQTLREQARLIARAASVEQAAAEGRREGYGGLGQEALVFLEELNGTSMGYQYQMVLDGPGTPDPSILERALRAVVLSQPALAARWRMTAGGLLGTAGPCEAVRMDTHVVASHEVGAVVAKLVDRPLRYDDFPLVRWDLVLHDGGAVLLQREHHIIHDGWSVGVFMDQLMAAYQAFEQGREWVSGDRGATYFDWTARQRDSLAGPAAERSRHYWRAKLALLEGESRDESPDDLPQPLAVRSQVLIQPLGEARSAELDRVAAKLGVTAFALLLAAFRRVAHPGADDVNRLVGTSFANRDVDVLDAVGFFVNVVPLIRAQGAGETPAEAARAEMKVISEAAHHQLPTPEVIRLAPAGTHLTRDQLYPVMFSKHDSPLPELCFGSWRPELRELANGSGKTGLEVITMNRGLQHARRMRGTGDAPDTGAYELRWHHDLERWPDARVRGLQTNLELLLDHALAQPDEPWPGLRHREPIPTKGGSNE